MKEVLIGKDSREISVYVESLSQPGYRGKQLAKWLYQKYVRDFEQMTDLSKGLRSSLSENSLISNNKVSAKTVSEDGTVKYLIRLNDGKTVECVNIAQPEHRTACLSSQVGCNVKCPFCATGLSGYKRNLSAGEIVDQYLLMQEESKERISHIVYMGMGEPLLNYEATLKSVFLLNKEIGIGMRNITISTSGFIRKIEKLMAEKLQLNLAVSLHTAEEELRNILVPINKNNPLDELLAVCKKYADVTKRRITFEYVMLKGINDSPQQAQIMADKLQGIHCHINLIPHNPVYSAADYGATSMSDIKKFRQVLTDKGFPATIRVSRGQEENSACGQLSVIQGA